MLPEANQAGIIGTFSSTQSPHGNEKGTKETTCEKASNANEIITSLRRSKTKREPGPTVITLDDKGEDTTTTPDSGNRNVADSTNQLSQEKQMTQRIRSFICCGMKLVMGDMLHP